MCEKAPRGGHSSGEFKLVSCDRLATLSTSSSALRRRRRGPGAGFRLVAAVRELPSMDSLGALDAIVVACASSAAASARDQVFRRKFREQRQG
jgi:hypothetical protein